MKYVVVFVLAFSGCATVSDYRQGCQDGVNEFVKGVVGAPLSDQDGLEKACQALEEFKKSQKNEAPRGRSEK